MMKKTWTAWMGMMLALLMLFAAAGAEEAEVFTAGDFQYRLLENGTAEITRYAGQASSLEIPARLDGKTVTSIGDRAFYGCRTLTSVSLPDSVISIGTNPFRYCGALQKIQVSAKNPALTVKDGVLFTKDGQELICYPCGLKNTKSAGYAVPQGTRAIRDNAFSSCGDLAFITLPEGVTSIGNYAFSGCRSLLDITLPDSVASIGANPFSTCTSLHSISVSPEHPALAVVDGVLFSKADQRLVCYPRGLYEDEYTVPQGTACIGEAAFYGHDTLCSITLPEGVTSIGASAFSGCANLGSVILPDSLTSLGHSAFSKCYSLLSIALPDGVTSIGDQTFSMCQNLESILLSADVTSVGSRAFYQCYGLLAITLPEGVTSIGEEAFEECFSLWMTVAPGSYAEQYAMEHDISVEYMP